MKRNKEPILPIPTSVQQMIPVRKLYEDGIFELDGGRYSMTYAFSDINWDIADDTTKDLLFQHYEEILNALDSDSQAMITLNNRRLDAKSIEKAVLIEEGEDSLSKYRAQLNDVYRRKMMGENAIIESLSVTITTVKANIEDARAYFARKGGSLKTAFRRLGSTCEAMSADQRLKIFHDFFRYGRESMFHWNTADAQKRKADFRDYIVPDMADFHRTSEFMLDDRYGRVLFISDLPSFLKVDFVGQLISSIARSMMISITISPTPPGEAVHMVQRHLTNVEDNIFKWQRRMNKWGHFSAQVPSRLEEQREEAREIRSDLTQRDQRMFFATVTLMHTADTMEQLEADTHTLIEVADSNLVQMRILRCQQLEGMQTTLPFGRRLIDIDRTLTTESLAALIPFRAQTIFQPGGQYFGQNAITGDMIVIDRQDDKYLNANMFVLGPTGSGKSFFVKQLLLWLILGTDRDVILIDPEKEYKALMETLGYPVIRISATSGVHINAMDLTAMYGRADDPITLKAQFLMSLCAQMLGETEVLGAREKSIIDRVTGIIFKPYIKGGYVGQPPTLQDFANTLLAQEDPEARPLALAMERFTEGSLNAFALPTNVDLSQRVICFDTSDLSEQLRGVAQLIIFDNIQNRVTFNRSKKLSTELIFEEAYLQFRHKFTAEYLDSYWRRFRKYGGACLAVTQNISEVLDNQYASMMIANSEHIVMLRQSETDLQKLSALLNLSPEIEQYLLGAKPGSGVIKAGSTYVQFENDFPTDSPLYPLMSTRIKESIE